MILKVEPPISFQGEFINFSRMNNYFKVKEYWLGVDLGNRIFLKRKPDTPKLHFLFANLICDS